MSLAVSKDANRLSTPSSLTDWWGWSGRSEEGPGTFIGLSRHMYMYICVCLYLYTVEFEGQSSVGKFAIVR